MQAYFGAPQDIEWTWAGGELCLVQARPVTSLYPLPAGIDPRGDLRVFGSVAAFQGMLDPFTPMGIDALRCFAALSSANIAVRSLGLMSKNEVTCRTGITSVCPGLTG